MRRAFKRRINITTANSELGSKLGKFAEVRNEMKLMKMTTAFLRYLKYFENKLNQHQKFIS